MPAPFDTLLVGLGAMGSAAAAHLARRGRRVLGLDRFTPPHTLGSSHGQTRIIREAYFEHPLYVPLIQRAYELWAELERTSGRTLLLQTGGLMVGPADGVVVAGARRSAEQHGLRHEVLTDAEIIRRFPALRPAPEMIGVWEPRAGILFPEACVEAHLATARSHGATLQFDETVLAWQPDGAGLRVTTDRGAYHTAHLVLTAGAWIRTLLPDLQLPFTIERQVQFWFEPRANAPAFQADRCPVHLWEYEQRRFFYGFPDLGAGVKVARHHEGASVDPDDPDRTVRDEDTSVMRQIVRRFLPDAGGPLRSAAVCRYTNTPDEHFFLDRHPAHPAVLIASPCSGHGFKFSSVIGEAISEWICDGAPRLDLGLFRRRSFSA